MGPVARSALAVAFTIAAGRALAQRAPAAVRITAPTATLRPESFYFDSSVCSSGTRAGRSCVGADLTVEAEVSDPAVTCAEVTVNGTSGVVPVREGRVVATSDWVEGNNRVSVAVRSGGRGVRDSMTRYVGASQLALRIRAAWSWPGERPVVRIVTPSGGRCEANGDGDGVRSDCAASEPGR